MRAPVAVIADDFTGAADAAAPFAERGWRTTVSFDAPHPDQAGRRSPSAVSVSTEARSCEADLARARTRSAVRTLSESGRRVLVKIDSTARGSVAAQVAGALDAMTGVRSGAFAVVCPAHPAMGRTVENGQVLVDRAPVASGDLLAVLPGAVRVALDPHAVDANAQRMASAGARGAPVVIDARDEDDLDEVAAAITLLGDRAVPVGSAGLARALAAAWSGAAPGREGAAATRPIPPDDSVPRLLVVVSSLHTASRQQYHRLAARLGDDDLVLELPRALVGDPELAASWAVERLAERSPPQVLVLATPERRVAEPGAPGRLVESLVEAACGAFDVARPHCLLLVGGDGAGAVLRRLGTRAVQLTRTLRDGAVLGTVDGGKADGHPVVTKAGGFGREDALVALTDVLAHHHETGGSPE